MSDEPQPLIGALAAKIVAAYVRRNLVQADQLPTLISTIYAALGKLGKTVEPEQVAPMPAVPIRRSVERGVVVCLECGWRAKMLRRHLAVQHGLRPEQYRQRWKLASDHPLTAPIYSEQRATFAKQMGLGRRGRGRSAATPTTRRRRRRT